MDDVFFASGSFINYLNAIVFSTSVFHVVKIVQKYCISAFRRDHQLQHAEGACTTGQIEPLPLKAKIFLPMFKV